MEYYIKPLARIVGDREQFEINGTTYPSNWLASANDAERGGIGALAVIDSRPELTATQAYGEPTLSIQDDVVVRLYPARPKTEQELAAEKLAYNESILAQIQELEQQQIRPQGEILAALVQGQTPNAFAVNKLNQIEAAKASLRSSMK